MKELRHEMRYDGATPDEVYAMLGTPAFREAVCEDQGFSRRTVTVSPAGDGMAVTIDQYRPADGVPSFARKLVGAEINVVQKERWTESTGAADIQVTIPGKPGDMAGTARLVGDENGTSEIVEMRIKVNLPLVSGKAEDLIASMLLKALKSENRIGRQWLADEQTRTA